MAIWDSNIAALAAVFCFSWRGVLPAAENRLATQDNSSSYWAIWSMDFLITPTKLSRICRRDNADVESKSTWRFVGPVIHCIAWSVKSSRPSGILGALRLQIWNQAAAWSLVDYDEVR